MMNVGNAKPMFEVERLPENYTSTVKSFKKNAKTGRLEATEKTVKGGFMAYFPQGHSIRVTTEAELDRLALNNTPPLVDMEHGVVYPVAAQATNRSLKEHVSRKTVSGHNVHFHAEKAGDE